MLVLKMETSLPTVAVTLLIAGGIMFAFNSSINYVQRTPYFNDKLGDARLYVPFINPYLSWCSRLLELATTKSLNLSDLPWVDYQVGCAYAHAAFANTMEYERFWKRVLWSISWKMAKLWTIKLFHVAFEFVPNWAMLRLLREFERHSSKEEGSLWVWIYLLSFAFATFSGDIIRNRLIWIQWAEIGIPLRGQLQTLIFEKTMRRKSSKEPPYIDESNEKLSKTILDKNIRSQKENLQGPLTLIASDVVDVSRFAANNHFIPSCILRFVISIAFLWSLLGWPSLLVGLLLNISFVPINSYFIRKNNAAKRNMVKAGDEKVAVIAEALSGIRQIKFAAQERRWEERIDKSRERELDELWKLFTALLQNMFCTTAGQILLATGAFTTYAIVNGDLTSSVAFTALGLFTRLEGTLSMLPDLMSDLIDAKLASARIESFLRAPEREEIRTPSNAISFENATFAWPSDKQMADADRFCLRNINAKFPVGELSVVSGDTGSGKSLLLTALLGEADLISGTITALEGRELSEIQITGDVKPNEWNVASKVAFVSQIPWIQNASIKTNILFDLPFNSERYNQVIEACALQKDLEMLKDGDDTEIGSQGINLSGGQRWRLTFARALYSRAGVLILDDIFAALDAHVGKEIFEKGLNGQLASGRTRILVTHHVGLCLPKASYLIHISNSTTEYAVSVKELQKDHALSPYLSASRGTLRPRESNSAETVARTKHLNLHNAKPKSTPKKFVQNEAREKGNVKQRVYLSYFVSVGGAKFWAFCISGFLGQELMMLSRSWWLKIWTSRNLDLLELSETRPPNHLQYYLCVYMLLSLVATIIGTLPYFLLWRGSQGASRNMFRKMTSRVLRMPLRWIDTVPQGRIINRFTGDFATLDLTLPKDFSAMVAAIFQVSTVIISGIIVSPYILVLCVILLMACSHFAKRYMAGARDVKRLQSITKSPILEHLRSSIEGLETIRAYNKTNESIEKMRTIIDKHTITRWYGQVFRRWLGFRLQMVGSVFSTAIAFMVVLRRGNDASLAGFAMAFSLQFASAVSNIISRYSNMELNMNAAERVVEFTNLETEPQGGIEVPAEWPSSGNIVVDDLMVRYSCDSSLILKSLSFKIKDGERVGVVGRTGAGKSTLTLALFRFLEAQSGSILVDGVDISTIKLHDLRRRLAIVPQDPVLFSGTIRSNIDPFDEFSDTALEDALKKVQLFNALDISTLDSNPNSSLATLISTGGLNFSQGQRQLLCLARLLIRTPKIIVLDEATSAVDHATDVMLQKSIRENFNGSTLLVIAHRISTVADFDRILVMDDGRAVEFGSPKELLAQNGIFASLVKGSGDRDSVERIILRTGGS